MKNEIWCQLILVLLMGMNICSAQDHELDSLKAVIESHAHDSLKLDAMQSLAWSYRNIDSKQAIVFGNAALNLAEELESDDEKAYAYNVLANAFEKANYPSDTILEVYDQALEFCRRARLHLFKADVINNKALIYKKIGNHDKALELYQHALQIAEELNGKLQACRILNNIAVLFRDRDEELELALSYYEKALRFAEELGREDYIAGLSNNIGNIYRDIGETDTALIYLNKALVLKRKSRDTSRIITTLSNIGRIYLSKKEYEISYRYLIEAYSKSKDIGYIYGIGLSLSNLAALALERQQYQQVILYSKEGLAALKEEGDLSMREEFHGLLAEAYAGTGDFKQAYESQDTYYSIIDSIYNLESTYTLNELMTKYQVQQKENENKLLKAEQKIDKARLRQQTWVGFGSLLIIVLLSLLLFFIHKNSNRKKQYRIDLEQEVNQKTEQLQELNQRLESRNIQLERFTHAASHDLKEPLRSIIGFSSLLERKEGKNLSQDGKEYLDFIKNNSLQMNFLVKSIEEFSSSNQSSVELVDLNDIIGDIKDQLTDNYSDRIPRIIFPELPSIKGSKTQFLLLFKHLIDNGINYNLNQNPTILIDYQSINRMHVFTITDDGIGIEEQYQDQIFGLFKRLHNRDISKGPGMGLAICKKIIDDLKGTISVQSNVNEGTTFTIEIPDLG